MNVYSIIESAYTLPCWNVIWERYTNLSMQFGAPSLHIREPRQTSVESERVRELFSYRHISLRGEWFLWIELAYWRLLLADGTSVTPNSPQRQLSRALGLLDGQKLTNCNINAANGKTAFLFDLGAELTVRRMERSTDRLWSLYSPNEKVLIIRADGQASYELSSEPQRWQDLTC